MCTVKFNGHRVPVEVRAGGKPTRSRPPLKGRKHRRRIRGGGRPSPLITKQAARIGTFIADLLGLQRKTKG